MTPLLRLRRIEQGDADQSSTSESYLDWGGDGPGPVEQGPVGRGAS